MPTLKSNYIKTDILSQCYRYELQVISPQSIDIKYHAEIQAYFQSINPNIVFSYPFVYSVQELTQLKPFNFMLSSGCKIQITPLISNTITLNSKDIPSEIHTQLIKLTNFLYSPVLNIALNPFQETKTNYNTTMMPAFSISTEVNNNVIGFYLVPLQARITAFQSLSKLHENSIILDYDSGTFYQKSAIVRYDKVNQILYFRTGQQLNIKSLKSMEIHPVTGFQLACRISSYYKRLRQSPKLKEFIQKWEIKFDSRFTEIPYNFFPTSNILAGNKQQKSLGQLIGSISAYNFQYHFRKLFSNLQFDDSLRANIYFLLPQIYNSQQNQQQSIDIESDNIQYYNQLVMQEEQLMLPIISQFENMKVRMNLVDCRITVLRYDVFVGWVNGAKKTIKQIGEIVEKENELHSTMPIDKIFVVSNLQDILKQQLQSQSLSIHNNKNQQQQQPLYKQIIQQFIQQKTYYHLVDLKENDFVKSPDVIGVKALATIYTKLRVNPWKIKDIPFGTKPLMAISLHVKLQTNNTVTVCIIASLNAFLSKYTCLIHKHQQPQLLSQTIINLITQSIQKFKSIHTIYPKRTMIFRTGDYLGECTENNIGGEFNLLQAKLLEQYACKATYIMLSSDSPLRVYNQIDYNYISKDTVKPTQLLCQLKYNNDRYIQFQTQQPLHKINILGVDQQEYNFQEKIIQLTTKLCFTYQIMTEMKFAKGLGFVSYGRKLYEWASGYKNTQAMEDQLKQGVLMFL